MNSSGVDIHDLFQRMAELHQNGDLVVLQDRNGNIQQIQTIAQLQRWVMECERIMLARAVERQRQYNQALMQQMGPQNWSAAL